ncbi:uncharacterized protein QC763_703570 [Podospora pseudopauciseta]|uniref:Uncharacterized protein n=1 Tax=Podospora pseudopauciseta TaxID=2093780 RepID=A0ABR0H092_9PEZI|nr:hypothetical protein QC763_703570 [Podospora pseudopauciseta]
MDARGASQRHGGGEDVAGVHLDREIRSTSCFSASGSVRSYLSSRATMPVSFGSGPLSRRGVQHNVTTNNGSIRASARTRTSTGHGTKEAEI